MYKNCIRNEHIDLIVKKEWIPASDFIQSQVTGASTILDAGFGTGAAEFVEVGSSNIGGIKLEAVTDDVNFLWVPSDFDNRHPLYIRYLWTSEYASANGTATFTTLYRSHLVGHAIGVGNTALTKTHGAGTKVLAAARTLYWSPYGAIAPIATGAHANHTLDPQTICVTFQAVCSAVTGITIASDFVYVLGMELTYTPRLTFGSNTRPARLLRDGLSANLELDVTNDI